MWSERLQEYIINVLLTVVSERGRPLCVRQPLKQSEVCWPSLQEWVMYERGNNVWAELLGFGALCVWKLNRVEPGKGGINFWSQWLLTVRICWPYRNIGSHTSIHSLVAYFNCFIQISKGSCTITVHYLFYVHCNMLFNAHFQCIWLVESHVTRIIMTCYEKNGIISNRS